MALVKIFIAGDSVQAHFVRSLLEREGIAAEVLGDQLAMVIGAVPMARGTLPAVWVAEEAEGPARRIIERFRSGQQQRDNAAAPAWTCPRCGETIESQFTDCWNCGMPQPGTEEQQRAGDAGPAFVVPLDVACGECQYNLRGLSPDGRCPECGQRIAPSLAAFAHSAGPEDQERVQAAFGPLAAAVAERVGCPPSAVLPLLDAWVAALGDAPDAGIAEPAEAKALRLCRAAVLRLAGQFADEQEMFSALRRWGLVNCSDLARVLSALAERGLIEPDDRLRPDHFPPMPVDRILSDRP